MTRAATAAPRKTRGKSKQKNWRRETDAPVAVIPLELDLSDPAIRSRVFAMFGAIWHLRRALQRRAVNRVDAYWRSKRLRASDPRAARVAFGLSRRAFEQAAAEHVDRSGWLRRHLTKAVAMHLADEIWAAVDRHLFSDESGNRHGRPRVGSWWTSNRIPGRARSHTKPKTWETFHLVGSLGAHREAGGHHGRTPIKPVERATWWDYGGPLAVVFTGAGDDLVLPIRLQSRPGSQARFDHFLGRPQLWHKVDLVRVEDPKAPGGWRVYAHLMILGPGWTSPAVAGQRAAAPSDRLGGVDGNVSSLAVVSMPADPAELGGLRTSLVTITAEQRESAARAAKKARDQQRSLDRSRRNSNPGQYQQSKRERGRADRRAGAGLVPRQVPTPTGARVANRNGVPRQAYRKDQLSPAYRRTRAEHAAAARSRSQAKHARAQQISRAIVAEHGPRLVVEHTNIHAWARLWGRGIALFSPGMLIAALKVECVAAGGRMLRAGTRQTALSQQCPCGRREKKPLSQRVHACPVCGLRGHRDLVAAAMGACVTFGDPDQPSTAYIDQFLREALAYRIEIQGQQDALTWSTATANARSPGVSVGTAAAESQRPLPDKPDTTETDHPPMTHTGFSGRREHAEPSVRHGPESSHRLKS
ncbi:hypothetical protein FB565_003872 [Actinoplanes lutulentus]|uniref:Putative transposase-like DNA-binding protein n=1 Tax=Actinoplanes lutulentus TaxID=1287878 RepID=A0A327ZN69_9ACTN|nr:zinc ribbon domain-containing protein [Actinoplanes lutulentus]MBB2944143.1 hypothetical protein [Actinoplanes lutulentus]RAK42624.1 putative transposase-like DNA-binding protein [Actinoplanes lutulentus]